jgi:hypothetical protein
VAAVTRSNTAAEIVRRRIGIRIAQFAGKQQETQERETQESEKKRRKGKKKKKKRKKNFRFLFSFLPTFAT